MNKNIAIRASAVSFEEEREALHTIRSQVFVKEQGVPVEIEMDERDPACRHVLARHGAKVVGCGRIDLEKGGKIGRVAVLSAYRRSGVGTVIMHLLHDLAREFGLGMTWCHAQRSAVPFYQKLKYQQTGSEFEEAGIPHLRMEHTL